MNNMRIPDAAGGVRGENKDGDLLNYGSGGNDKDSAWNTKPGDDSEQELSLLFPYVYRSPSRLLEVSRNYVCSAFA